MVRIIHGVLIACLAMAGGCDRTVPVPDTNSGGTKAQQIGVASFYSNEAAGKRTASGEPLKLDGMTAASRTLPLGTPVVVTNTENGRSTVVKINDRGPYVKGRVLDLTPKAARHIGIDRKNGLGEVSIQPLEVHQGQAERR